MVTLTECSCSEHLKLFRKWHKPIVSFFLIYSLDFLASLAWLCSIAGVGRIAEFSVENQMDMYYEDHDYIVDEVWLIMTFVWKKIWEKELQNENRAKMEAANRRSI